MAIVAAFALVNAMAVPVASACRDSHVSTEARGAAAESAVQGPHANGGSTDCQETGVPRGQDHGSDCLDFCQAMMGCSVSGFVAESALIGVTELSSTVPALPALTHSSRSAAPDRPPPRV